MVRMRDVAKRAGVCQATVSAALSGRGYVRAETRQRILAAVEELGYAPDLVARSLRRGSTQTFGLIVPEIVHPFYAELVQAIERTAHHAGYAVLLATSGYDPKRELQFIRLMRARGVDGLILMPVGEDQGYDAIGDLAAGPPLVLVGNAPPALEADTVLIDNYAAAFRAASHLVDQGHTRIAALTGPETMFIARETLRGLRDALAEKGLALDPALVRQVGQTPDDACAAGRALLALDPPPTAIFGGSTHMVTGALMAVAACGLSCPDDISVTGINDGQWVEVLRPGLTTIRQPGEHMGMEVVRLLLKRIDHRDAKRQTAVFDAELMLRDSVSPPPQIAG